jgi:hypothetical protein
MPASQQFAYIEGLNATRRLLKPLSELVDTPWRDAMTELAESGAEGGQARAPYRTGRLREKIYARVQKGPFPKWAAVRSRAKSRGRAGKRGYDYPRLLEYSPKHHHQGWFTSTVYPLLIARAEGVLAKAATAIQRRWGR